VGVLNAVHRLVHEKGGKGRREKGRRVKDKGGEGMGKGEGGGGIVENRGRSIEA